MRRSLATLLYERGIGIICVKFIAPPAPPYQGVTFVSNRF
jgi:hypothetical protein